MGDVRTGQAYVTAVITGGKVETSLAHALVAVLYTADEIRTDQQYVNVAAEPELEIECSQAYVLVAIRRGIGSRKLRAWTFTQDDHDFYVLHLGDSRTLVFDLTTEQWCTWKSNGRNVWRAGRGMRWDLDNVGGDDTIGLLWDINADVRTDDAITGDAEDRVPIVSIVRGLYPMRLRSALSCARAVLTVSQGDPSADNVGITLRTSDDFGRSWLSHGEVLLDAPATEYDVAWVSLGLIAHPGKIFEITDTGYARRIDGLDIDLGDGEEQGSRSGGQQDG